MMESEDVQRCVYIYAHECSSLDNCLSITLGVAILPSSHAGRAGQPMSRPQGARIDCSDAPIFTPLIPSVENASPITSLPLPYAAQGRQRLQPVRARRTAKPERGPSGDGPVHASSLRIRPGMEPCAKLARFRGAARSESALSRKPVHSHKDGGQRRVREKLQNGTGSRPSRRMRVRSTLSPPPPTPPPPPPPPTVRARAGRPPTHGDRRLRRRAVADPAE